MEKYFDLLLIRDDDTDVVYPVIALPTDIDDDKCKEKISGVLSDFFGNQEFLDENDENYNEAYYSKQDFEKLVDDVVSGREVEFICYSFYWKQVLTVLI